MRVLEHVLFTFKSNDPKEFNMKNRICSLAMDTELATQVRQVKNTQDK